MSNIKFCQNCRSRSNKDLFYSGYYNWLDDNCYECPMKDCGHKLIDIDLSKEEFDIIISISKDIVFLETMIQLKENNIIEYNLKLSQFKSQIRQQKLESNQPHCPTCGSINIKSISGINRGASIAMWGLFSKKLNKSFECLDCKYTW